MTPLWRPLGGQNAKTGKLTGFFGTAKNVSYIRAGMVVERKYGIKSTLRQTSVEEEKRAVARRLVLCGNISMINHKIASQFR